MKNKVFLFCSSAIGLAAAAVRILQYIFTIGSDGYYTGGPRSDFLSGMLVGILLAGLAWCLLSTLKAGKENIPFRALYGESPLARVLMLLLGLVSAADAVVQLLRESTPLLICALCGAVGWILLAVRARKEPGLLTLLPLVPLCGSIITYFLETYKYIHISAYILNLLWLCVLLLFTLALMRTAAGADCSRRRLIALAQLTVLASPAVLPGLLLERSAESLLMAANAILFLLLALFTLYRLPGLPLPAPAAETAPDLEKLNEFVSNLPEVEEEDEDPS